MAIVRQIEARDAAAFVALSEALDAAMKDEKTVAILRTLGTEPDPTGPDAMGEILRRDYDRWGEIVRITGAKPE